jgi:glycosyltransferase involved in cell wall biosynthesis
VRVRLLIANGFTSGGTIRTTLNTAVALSKYHEVEIVSVYRYRSKPLLPVDPRVELRWLADYSKVYERRLEAETGLAGWAHRQGREFLLNHRSRLIHPKDFRYPRFNLLTDVALYKYLRSVRDGVLVGTRAGLNMAIARHARPSVVRVGQEHLHYGVYVPEMLDTMRKLLPRLDAFVALTERDAARWRELMPEAPIQSIPNAVPDTGDGVSPLTEKVVVAAGRFASQKGFDMLIPAWRVVAERHPDWELRIYGDGKERDNLQKLIDKFRLGDSVRLMGASRRMYDDMRKGSILVMSSRFEGFPMVLLEGMACGLPPVAFDFPNGARELIADGANGVLVKHRDVDALGAGLCQLIEDPAKRMAYGARAAATVREYDSERLAERWHDLFTDLARRK